MVDITALNTFKNINLGNENAIVNLNDENKLSTNSTFSKANIFRFMRSSSTQANNNQIRTELLKSLGKAFGLENGIGSGSKGEVTFSKDFMDKLENILGPAFKRSDFGVPAEGGAVKSGKPLTQRRIKEIMTQASVYESKDFSIAAYKNKLSAIMKELGMPDVTKVDQKNLDKMFKGNPTARIFADIQRSLNFLENDLDKLVKNDSNYEFDLELAEGDENKIKELAEKTQNKFKLLDLNTNEYVDFTNEDAKSLGSDVLWPILGGELIHTEWAAFDSEKSASVKPFKDYIANTIKSFVKNGIDSYLEAKRQGKMELFNHHVATRVGACMEDKGKHFIEFRQQNLEGPIDKAEEAKFDSIINKNNATTQKEMIEAELNDLFKQNPKGEWADYAPVLKERLSGQYATVIEVKEDEVSGKTTYSELVENGKVVVRKITDADIDRLGEALYDDILMGN